MRIDTLHPVTSRRLQVIADSATLEAAALAFSAVHIGLLIVCDADGTATGIVSKSDLIRHLPAGGSGALVTSLMSRAIVSCAPGDDLRDAWRIMANGNLQNMPVLSADAKPLGVLDIRDAMKVLFEEEELQEHLLANYVAGVGYQ
jgi:CBS domain-containing protein